MRLRKLSLSGFKSFADRTEFVFDDGITCVVGPNGCGKSNVVDAIKWVLGEQSAKSLRGGEMMDVIFNGCSSRRPTGMAEVTLEFDNTSGSLQTDVPASSEKRPHLVSVTRRLYRSGESEYRINTKVVRLRDVREMFLDTGLGGRSYSLIEQGKVAEMLQANPQERRVIFEEVAGISKYKARKKEAFRKLERVEQNLLRANDIIAEVQKRLRSIKYQAGKARNYQTYSERLSELRGLYSLAQYHTLTHQRTDLQSQLDHQHDRVTGIAARISQFEANQLSTEAEIADLRRQRTEIAGQIATVSGQITGCEERIEMLTRRCRELTEQLEASGERNTQLTGRIAEAETSIEAQGEQLQTVELQILQCSEQVEAMLDEQLAGQVELTRLTSELESQKDATLELLHRTSQLHNQITAADVRAEAMAQQRTRLESQSEQIARQAEQLTAEQGALAGRSGEIATMITERTARLETAKADALRVAEQEHQLDSQIQHAKETRSSRHSRRSTLDEMQRRGEGLSDGVKRVIEARQSGQIRFIRGMVAEFVRADFTNASVVAAALADIEQCMVVDTLVDLNSGCEELVKVLDDAGIRLLCLDQLGPVDERFDPAGLPVLTQRLIDLVHVDIELGDALQQLLSRTLIVDDMAAATVIAGKIPSGYRVVTRDGAVLDGDGRVRLGQIDAAGIIARDSEMAELATQLSHLETKITQLTGQRNVAAAERAELDTTQQDLRTSLYEANAERVDVENQVRRIGDQLCDLQRQAPLVGRELETLAAEMAEVVSGQAAAREQVGLLDATSAQRQGEIEQLNRQIAERTARQDHLTKELTENRVSHAQALQKKAGIAEAMGSLRRSIEHMQRERDDVVAQAETGRERIGSAEEGITGARGEIEALFARKVDLDQLVQDVEESGAGLTERTEQIRKALSEHRSESEQAHEKANGLRIQIGETDVRIEELLRRVSDELGVDLSADFGEYEHDNERDWDAVATEIQQLRAKIDRLGNVNLDAIDEQEELEQRETFLAEQMSDIEQSKDRLTELIDKINAMSQTMFAETFAAVREQFQSIFRKLFGGGKADILLTDPDDILESGVEIIARPPGKELRSISLLSGGEKTMTTVALVFSIFRTKPSPFCVLDEVDAALDEANNERFNLIIEEFLDQSQFIVITHSKRTMAIANVLYGVTMQEAGVSRRVSVKFEQAARMVDEDEAKAKPELVADAAAGD